MQNSGAEITQLLRAWQRGDAEAAEELFESVYGNLRAIARKQHRNRRRPGELQTTELVHELYLRFDRGGELSFDDRRHFYVVASRAIRFLLIDYAREWLTERRGGGARRVTLNEEDSQAQDLDREAAEMIDMDRALAKLEAADERLARMVQLRFFGGYTYDEIAEILGVGRATVSRDWRVASAWLKRELEG